MPCLTENDPVTVLLVEDDDQMRGVCRSVLAERGFDVLEADNGLEALLITMKRQGAIDVVITELAMPKMSGSELGRAFQEIWPGMNVLYMSASPREAVRHELPPDCAFLPKPFAPDELVNAVGSILEGKQGDRIRA